MASPVAGWCCLTSTFLDAKVRGADPQVVCLHPPGLLTPLESSLGLEMQGPAEC